MKKRVICIGAVTMDCKLKTSQPLRLRTSNIASSSQSFGGVAHNVAKNLAQLTDEVSLLSLIGDDVYGRKMTKYLEQASIGTKYIYQLKNKKTAEYHVVLDHDGEMLIALADMEIFDDMSNDIYMKMLERVTSDDIVFIDTNFPQEIISNTITYCNVNNITLFLDPVSVQKSKKLPDDLRGIYMLKPDRYEAEAITGDTIQNQFDAIKAAKKIQQRGARHCIITLGKEGYVIVNDNMQKQFSVPFVEDIKDVSGAGDAFFAGAIYATKMGMEICDACSYGTAAAALTLQSEYTVNQNVTLSHIEQYRKLIRNKNHAFIF